MSIRDLVPRFGRGREQALARRGREDDPFHAFQRQMNRLFDDFFGEFGLVPRGEGSAGAGPVERFTPGVDVSETDKEVTVTAELPGLEEKDVSVEMDDAAVTIRGERREEREEKEKNWHRRELCYGSFHRVVPLPAAVDGAKAKATFKKGILKVTAPKREEDRVARKRIPIQTG